MSDHQKDCRFALFESNIKDMSGWQGEIMRLFLKEFNHCPFCGERLA